MAIRDILQIGDPRLKAKDKAVKKFQSLRLKQVVKDLVETMHQNDLEVNIIYEGCGSVAHGDLFGPVKRPKLIVIEASDQKQQKFHLRCDGLLARVIQHEYDHLSGIEFTEKIIDYKKLMNRDFYLREIKNSPPQTQASVITVKRYSKV